MENNEQLLELVKMNTDAIQELKNTLETCITAITLASERVLLNKETIDVNSNNISEVNENLGNLLGVCTNLTTSVSEITRMTTSVSEITLDLIESAE